MTGPTREMTRKPSKVCSQKRRQAAALQSPGSFRGEKFVSIRVHSWLPLQDGNEMAQFLFHISGHGHRLRNLITQ